MYPRKRIDIGWSDLGAGLFASKTGHDEQSHRELVYKIEHLWQGPHYKSASLHGETPWVCTLSVRTGFDLALQALALPRGSEILVSAITIPHMLDIIEFHGLVAVPVDLDMAALSVDASAFESRITPKTKAILVAHLFGSRMCLDAIAEVAKKHDLLLFEDAAQAFIADDYVGHEQADFSMFSFGSIKSFTALGGAMISVANREVRNAIRDLMSSYDIQNEREYFKKILKHVPLRYVGGSPRRYSVLTVMASTFGEGHDHLVMSLTRGFPGSELIPRIRFRPCYALLTVLRRRLEQAHESHLFIRRKLGQALSDRLRDHVEIPGVSASHRTWWLFAVVVPSPDTLRVILQDAGFDAALGSTSITWVHPPEGSDDIPVNARRVMSSILYLPIDPAMDDRALDRMSSLIIDYLKTTQGGSHHAHLAAGQHDSTSRLSHGDSKLSGSVGSDEEADQDARCA